MFLYIFDTGHMSIHQVMKTTFYRRTKPKRINRAIHSKWKSIRGWGVCWSLSNLFYIWTDAGQSIHLQCTNVGGKAIFQMTFISMQKVCLEENWTQKQFEKSPFSLVPLHVLYSYDDSSDDDEKKDRLASNSTHSQKLLVQPTNRALNKMPPVHKIVPQHTHGRWA